ncbi:AIM24 family protein, partial [Streptomyces sp. CBMA291]|uniref:AIM24 family protein n=1 Tax=Streptomyces sp. CBMA291 TaxID=1930279 RepID=UPI0016610E78
GAPPAPPAPQPPYVPQAPHEPLPPHAPQPPAPLPSVHSAPTMVAPLVPAPTHTPTHTPVPPPGPAPAPYGQPPQPPQHGQVPGPYPGQAPGPYPQQGPPSYGQNASAPYGQPSAPYGQAPAPYGQHQGVPGGVPGGAPAAGAGLAAALAPYKETATGARWTPQNQQLMRVDLGKGGTPVLARQGSMVMYQGKVDFGYKGAGFAGRIVGNATGQEMQLMRCTGRGQVFLAEEGTHLHPIELQGDGICVSAENVLAFDESLQYEVRRIEGHGIPGGALFTMQFHGSGTVVVKTHGTPVVLPVTPTTFADCNAVVAWSSAAQVVLSSQVRLRRNAYPGHSGETVNLQFRGAPGNFVVVQPYEV